MRAFIYFFIMGFFLLIFETTFLSYFFEIVLEMLGLKSLSYFCVDTLFILSLYLAVTRRLKDTAFLAFFLGYLKDLFVLSGAWLNPMLFLIIALLSGLLKNVIMIKGPLNFVLFTFSMSIVYTVFWTFISYNLPSDGAAIKAGLYAVLPNAAINAMFAWIFYWAFSWFDSATGLAQEERESKLIGKI